ncbi:hypothetical protein ACFV3O_08935, partial [Streptomyces albidoflavus]
MAGPEAAIENRGWVKRLTAYAWRHPKDVILSRGAARAGRGGRALGPLITKVVIDDVIGGSRS